MFFNRINIGVAVIIGVFIVFFLGNLFVLDMSKVEAISRALYAIIPVSIGVALGGAYNYYKTKQKLSKKD